MTVYLDYAASTPVDSRVLAAMTTALTTASANPSSVHRAGRYAHGLVEQARCEVADALNLNPLHLIWTSGATEANNLAIQGAARRSRKKHIITTLAEHKSILEPCRALEQQGYHVTYLNLKQDGRLDLRALREAFTAETFLVTLCHANSETGVLQDIPTLKSLVHSQGCLLHLDIVQSVGRLDTIPVTDIDFLSLSAHKAYGPKGIGALYVADFETLKPLLYGGGQEVGLRPGTLPTHQIVGMGAAYRLLPSSHEISQLKNKRDKLWQGLKNLPDIHHHGDFACMLPSHLNVTLPCPQVNIKELIPELLVSSGSACLGNRIEVSPVLMAMGVQQERAQHAVRFSIGRFTTMDEIDFAVELIQNRVSSL